MDATQVHDVLEVPTPEDVDPGRRSECDMERISFLIPPHGSIMNVLGSQCLGLGIECQHLDE